MADTIKKGITVSFRGDTKDFDTSVDKVNKKLTSLKSETKLLNRELKLDPTNVSLLEKKFDSLKEKQKLLNEQIDNYKDAMKGVAEGSDEYKKLDNEVRNLTIDLGYTNKAIEQMGGNKISVALNGIASKFKNIGKELSDIAKKTAPLSAMATGILAPSVKLASEFEQKMSQVNATMGITAETTSELNGQTVNTTKALSDLAVEMGGKTRYSASECAEALNYLALSGYSTQEMADTLPTVLNLASSGSIDLARASDMVTDAMASLGLTTSDAVDMVDLMAKTASSSNTSVEQLGDAILTIGGTAKALKGGTQELSTALGILANNGIKGAEGGTALRNILLALQTPTDKASKKLKEMSVNVFDADGNMRSMSDILSEMDKSLSSMSDQDKAETLSTIFNKKDLASAQALLSSVGGEWDNLSQKLANASGSAQQMSDTQLNNLNGQITILKSSLESLAISLGQTLIPFISKVVMFVQGLVDKFNSLDDGAKTTLTTILGAIALITPVLMVLSGVFTSIGTVISTVSTAIGFLTTMFKGLWTIMKANPVGAVITIIYALVVAFGIAYEKSETFRNGVNKLAESIMTTVTEAIDWGISKINAFIDVLKSAWDWLSGVLSKVGELASSGISKIGSFFGGGSGGFGNNNAYMSGGYGTLQLQTTINVNNNGSALSVNDAQRFGREIVDYVNNKLGRRI